MSNVLQFKYDLHLIVIAQYNKPICSSNNEYDDSDYLTEFLEVQKPETRKITAKVLQASTILQPQQFKFSNSRNLPTKLSSEFDVMSVAEETLNILKENGLYHAAGYLIASIQKRMVTSEFCISSVGSKTAVDLPYAKFVTKKKHTFLSK